MGGALTFSIGDMPQLFADSELAGEPHRLSDFLEIRPDGTITILAPNPELGQGVHTSLAMILAEELDASWQQVHVRQAPSDAKYGTMSVGGSDSIVDYGDDLRRVGATAREMLRTAAAEKWSVPVDQCFTEQGIVRQVNSDRRASYASLLEIASRQAVPSDPPRKTLDEFKIVGHPTTNLHSQDIVKGRAIFGLDVRLAWRIRVEV